MSVWAAMLGMGIVTLALRASFLALPEGVALPGLLRRALRFVPAAVLTAVWAPELLLQKGVLVVAPENERLLAGAVAIAVAWRWRMSFATIAAGLVALHFFDWLV
jgi:branched-subunit amino acid transport protein